MLVQNVLGNINGHTSTKKTIQVNFEWFELEKKRIKKIAYDGVELGIAVSCPLKNGDILAETADKIYVVEVLPTELLKVNVSSMQEMGRACFELGNRHLSPKITENAVMVVYDQPTYQYMEHIGFNVEQITDIFTDYIVCKAHGHEHNHIDHCHAGEEHE